MAQIIVMPALGNTVESCLINTWLVKVGDTVDDSTVVAEIETDKATMDLPAGASGVVLALLAGEGDDVPVKSPLLVVGAAGEDASAALAAAGLAAQPAGAAETQGPTGQGPSAPAASQGPTGQGPSAPAASQPATAGPDAAAQAAPTDAPADLAASPRARARADAEGIPLSAITTGTGPHGRVLERDVTAALASGRPTRSARGEDVAGLAGTGIGGRVTAADAAARTATPTPLADLVSRAPATAFPGASTDTPLRGIRKIVAERMMNALATSAQLTYTASAPATGMLALRTRFKNADAELGYGGVTLGDLVNFAAVRVLKRHANLNAHLADGVLRTFESVHLGLAVDTPRGLLVPTIRNADALTLRELSAATKELAEACQTGKVDPDLLTGATFTVSNLGNYGIESFTPIINVPQTGILGVNTIAPAPVLRDDGSAGAEQRISFSLTADHQVVDGADAGRFLADLVQAIEDIDLTVMG